VRIGNFELLGVRRISGRRMDARSRGPDQAALRAHAERLRHRVGRALIRDGNLFSSRGGSIAVPDVLQPYMGGLKVIE